MRLTRRGWAALAVVALAVWLGSWAGQRALNALAAPVLAAIVLGAIQVWLADPPTVERTDVRPGEPGDRRSHTVAVEGSGVARVLEDRPAGVGGDSIDAVVSLPHEFETDLALDSRGLYRLGPATVRQRDALGLVVRTAQTDATTEVVVYPRRYDLGGSEPLARLLADELAAERQEFDRLREYVPGDPLRNVHWKSSAKHDDFLVMEFAPTRRTETVRIVADAAEGCADEMAATAASIADRALSAGFDVGLTLPEATLPAGQGQAHRENALAVLARVGPGSVPDEVHAEADVSIRARDGETQVRITDRTTTLADLVGEAPAEVTAR